MIMVTDIDEPPRWVTQLMQTISDNITSEDPINWKTHLYADKEQGNTWYLEASPTLHEDENGFLFREYQVHLTPILKLFKQLDVVAEFDQINIYGKHKTHGVHVTLMLEPDADAADEMENPPDPSKMN